MQDASRTMGAAMAWVWVMATSCSSSAPGKGERVVALVLHGNAQRVNAPLIPGPPLCWFGNDEVEQLLPRGQCRAGQCRDIMAQPLGERSDVARQVNCVGLDLTCVRGVEADGQNLAVISMVYDGQIRGVCLSRGGG
jgi:hypothetical protein